MQDIKNLDKAFKLLDKDNDGEIQYDIEKMTDSKLNNNYKNSFIVNKKEDEMRRSCDYTKVKYDEFMNIMLDNIAKNRSPEHQKKGGIIFESGKSLFYHNIYLNKETSCVTCFICPFNKNEEEATSVS